MEQQLASSKQQQRSVPLRLAINAAPFPRPNWSLEDWHLQNSPHHQHLPHHHAAISASASGYCADVSNLDELTWHPMTSQSLDEAEFSPVGPFPERRGEPNCVFYMRTGHCGFGMNCRYNHPPNRNLAATLARDKGEYPERVGQPECQYYLKTGTCKFGLTCKFHHPKDRAGYMGSTSVNILGFPLRQGERDCSYYMRTGSCKFGATCRFNHPQPSPVRALVTMSGSSVYASNGSSAATSPHSFPTGMPSWSLPRAPYMPRSRFQGPSSFAPLIVQPQNIVSVPGWGAYQARIGPQQPVLGGGSFMFGTGAVNEATSGGIHTNYNPYVPGSATGPPPAMQSTFLSSDSTFPERPGQLECQYYMKTGDCKFGMSCRFHHPRERASTIPSCILSPVGLPLRQGAPQCSFYMQYGMCKFGPTCKFDHPPTNSLAYSPSASSLMDMPVAPYPVGLSVVTPMPPGDATKQGTTLFHKRVAAAAADKQQGYEESYLGSESTVSSNAQSGSAVSSGSSSADSVELRGDSSQAALNASM
eukprot:c12054_g1_i1 orf=699-2291(-)